MHFFQRRSSKATASSADPFAARLACALRPACARSRVSVQRMVATTRIAGGRRTRRSAAWAVAIVFALSFGGAAALCAAEQPAQDPVALEARIQRLIKQLGADEYGAREAAKVELQRIGLPAFDALDEARDDEDLEVALRARYLLKVMSVFAAPDDDPVEVRTLLRGYGELSEADRKGRMERLASQNTPRSLAALCRLARYDSSRLLAKEAALMVMSAETSEDPAVRASLAASIETSVDVSKRAAAKWLRLYARTLVKPADQVVDEWRKLMSGEVKALASARSDTSETVVQGLLRWQSDFFIRAGRQEEAVEAAQRLVAATNGTSEQLGELVGWLVERKYWKLVQQVADKHSTEFDDNALLLYRLAEAYRRQGDNEKAEATAQRAFAIEATDAPQHHEIGVELRDRGLFDWAEREFRHVIAKEDDGDSFDMNARYRLAEMLWDIEQPLKAAMVWQELLDQVDKSQEVRDRLGEGRQQFRSRMHYFYAQDQIQKKQYEQARTHLEKGIREDPTDADVLIAMSRLPNQTPELRQKTQSQIADAAAQFQEQARRWELIMGQPLTPEQREQVGERLATACNQYAWLVGNTATDVDEAIRMSRQSVELMPKSGSYYDTLAHCYFAKKDYENAVKYQTLAVKFEPNTLQIKRQLKVFQKTLEDSKRE